MKTAGPHVACLYMYMSEISMYCIELHVSRNRSR